MANPNNKPTSYVYVIGPRYVHPVKIGVTTNLQQRLKALQVGNATPLTVLWSTEGGRGLEKDLHARFAEYRQAGEWFHFGDDDPLIEISSAVTGTGRLKTRRPQVRRQPAPASRTPLVRWVPASAALASLMRPVGADPSTSVSPPAPDRRAPGYLRNLGALLFWASSVAVIWLYGSAAQEYIGHLIDVGARATLRAAQHVTAPQVIAAVAVFFAVRTVVKDLTPRVRKVARRRAASARRLRPALRRTP